MLESNILRSIIKTVDFYGREIQDNKKAQPAFNIYSDGTTEKVYRF